jgi:diguanylate cyclase (GGDEF)-like protein/PAS domain S-box-containing protein
MPTDPAPTLPAAPRPPDRSLRPWAGVAVVLVLVLAGLAIVQQQAGRRADALSAAQTLARQLEAPVADALAQADTLLRSAAWLARDSTGRDWPESKLNALQALAAASPGLEDLRIADADGRWRLRPGKPAAAMSATTAPPAAGEAFQRARVDADAGLIVTGPVRQLADGQAVLVLSRALRGADGRFAGLVSVDLPTQRLAALLGGTDLGDWGVASLRDAQLLRLAQHPAQASLAAGQPATGGGAASASASASASENDAMAALREAVALNPLAGQVELPGAAQRLLVYRQVQGSPLVLLVDLPRGSGWSLQDTTALALALAALGAAAWTWQLQQRRMQRSQDAAGQPWADFVAAAPDAVLSETIGGVLTGWNPAARQLFGYSAAQMLGQSLQRLVPAAQRAQTAAWLARAHRGETLCDVAAEWLRSDGRALPVALTVLPTLDAGGSVSGVSYIVRDLSGRKALEDELRQRAFHDPLTRLPNRRLLRDRLGRAQQTSRRLGSVAAVLVLGGDDFKALQLRLGHEAGEQWLLAAAQRLSAAVRETDTVARLDGPEFVVVCENLGADPLQAARRAVALEIKLHAALTQPVGLGGELVSAQVSIGRRLFSGTDDDIDRLIADADQAMLQQRARHAPPPAQDDRDDRDDEDDED